MDAEAPHGKVNRLEVSDLVRARGSGIPTDKPSVDFVDEEGAELTE